MIVMVSTPRYLDPRPSRWRHLGGLLLLILGPSTDAAEPPRPASKTIRVATYNVAMYRDRAGQLAEEFETGNSKQAKQIAEVLQRVRPDVVLLNEFDYEYEHADESLQPAAKAFLERYLNQPQAGLEPLEMPHRYTAPVNTGVDSGHDLNHDGELGGPDDAWGYGRYPGQYGMLLLSKFPIDRASSFQHLRWKDAFESPTWPMDPKSGEHDYTAIERSKLRLSSKSFWDISIHLPSERILHLLCSHPTPPVFDGPEDRNGCRNYDEIRMVAKYVDQQGAEPYKNDQGEPAGLPEGDPFVVLGDLNADPNDGDSRAGAIDQLLELAGINATQIPTSDGGVAASQRHAELNADHQGDPAHDTADFSGDEHGNLRVDYVLPSKGLKVVGSGVYWPKPGEPGATATEGSDHRLVWIDIGVE